MDTLRCCYSGPKYWLAYRLAANLGLGHIHPRWLAVLSATLWVILGRARWLAAQAATLDTSSSRSQRLAAPAAIGNPAANSFLPRDFSALLLAPRVVSRCTPLLPSSFWGDFRGICGSSFTDL